MTRFESLPEGRGVYLVETLSGTVHVISRLDDLSWMRIPGAGAGSSRYDGLTVRVRALSGTWSVGDVGALTVSDETYLYTATIHLTAEIVSITDDPGSDDEGGKGS